MWRLSRSDDLIPALVGRKHRQPGGSVADRGSRRSSLHRIIIVLVALAFIAGACGSSKKGGGTAGGSSSSEDTTKPQYGGDVTYAQEAEDAGGLCLAEAQLDISGINYARTIYDTLTAPNDKGEFVPFLAQSVTPNADFTNWTIVLRPGIKFHDGSDLTATVVKNNIDAYRGQYKARSPLLFALVFGPYIDTVTATDAMTVDVKVKQPWPAFSSYLWSS